MTEPDLAVTMLGTGSPMPDPNRAGPAMIGEPWPLSTSTAPIEIGDDLHRVVVSPRT